MNEHSSVPVEKYAEIIPIKRTIDANILFVHKTINI